MMSKFANSEEIQNAHNILLSDKPEFEPDKIQVLECDESRDVKACPGSGKTTTLLAKLIVLANKMPLPNNQGICVLTHTNVAIDEIKSKLGHKADVLFCYPNYFGTIQSFVNKFFAIPYYHQIYDVPLRYIDSDKSEYILSKLFSQKTFEQKKPLYREVINRIDEKLSGAEKSKQVNTEMKLFLNKLWIDLGGEHRVYYRKYKDSKAFIKKAGSYKYNLVDSLRYTPITEGVLSYNDAYSFAFAYLEKFPCLKQCISSRFSYLFVDEMQDTNQKQLDLLNLAFDADKTILQRFGDHHQAIYDDAQSENIWIPANPLSLNSSKRFGDSIAKVLETVCFEDNRSLVGDSSVQSIKPIMLVYTNPEEVLRKYAELVKTRVVGTESVFDLSQRVDGHKIKAIGWVGSTPGPNKTTIQSYFPQYQKDLNKENRIRLDSLKSFLCKNDKNSLKMYADSIISGLIQLLYIAGYKYLSGEKQKYYSKTSLIDHYRQASEDEYRKFRVNLASWSKRIHTSESIVDEQVLCEVREFVKDDLRLIFPYEDPNNLVANFVESDVIVQQNPEEEKLCNKFVYSGVEIEVASVHSVKGETHAATLYMETSYHGKHESEYFANQIKGSAYDGTQKRTIEALKVAYVGMSRPKYLLCMAVQKDRFEENFKPEELSELWEVVHCVE